MDRFTQSKVKELFDTVTYNRGLDYYHQGKAKSWRITRYSDRHVLDGNINGNGRIYQTKIILHHGVFDAVENHCSCPMGGNCKHVVALLLEYVAYQNQPNNPTLPKAKSELESWLEVIQTLSTPKTHTHQPDNYFLTYRLFSANRPDDLLFYKSKYLKSGQLSQGTKLDSYKAVSTSYYREIKDEDDFIILKMLYGDYEKQYYGYSSRPVKFENNAFWHTVLRQIIATNRAYYDTHQEPLRFIEEVFEPTLGFKKYDNLYSIKSDIDTKIYHIIPSKPPLILNKINNTLQEFGMESTLYHKLLGMPKIPLEDIAKVYHPIAKATPNLQIPKAMIAKKITTPPQIHLTLLYEKNLETIEHHQLYLCFNYEEHSIEFYPQHASHLYFDKDGQIEIVRHLEIESQAKTQLHTWGFEPIQQGIRLYLKATQNKQEGLKVWREFLQTHIATLEELGWLITYDESFGMKFESNAQIVVENQESNQWFSLGFNLEFNGISQPIAPLIGSIINQFDDLENLPDRFAIEVQSQHYVEVSRQQIAPIIKTILELYNKEDKEGVFQINPFDAHLIEDFDPSVVWKGSQELLQLSQKLKDFTAIERQTPPKALNATLREYQQEGLDWLGFLHQFKFGGILADDMGLGKTIQTLAHLSRLKETQQLKHPSLIVVPTSLIANWKKECAKFTPNLTLLSLHGSQRSELFEQIGQYDIVLSTYALVVRDEKEFGQHTFEYIILDEAQKIKNPKAKMTLAIKSLKSHHRLALSGTPIENHLGELWSIFSFAMPGFLDTYSLFKQYYQTPIEKERDMSRQAQLNRRLKPFIVRRTKERVAHELPAKSEIIKYTQFESKQSKLYETIRVTMEQKVKEAISQKGLSSSHITILDALLKLRQVCCDPSLLKLQEAQNLKESAKLTLFLDLIDELIQEGRKILVFSQFTSMLSILEREIQAKKIKYTKLTGSTRKREEAIEQFTSGEADIFLISLKAGGVGLNLTQADSVIHYDPWWNPAVENQATDRAYRIGQDKKVFVYKLIVENTIEQKILELQKQKEALQQGIYEQDGEQNTINFKADELLELLKL